jgi:hypothetical protein
MKNKVIIFSKNRACQLQLLFDSIALNAPYFFDKINVLYLAEGEHQNGYNKLIMKYPFITFINETDFKKDVLDLITLDYDFTTFLVDDAIIYDEIPNDLKQNIFNNFTSDVCCFSLRLGLNCNFSHPANMSYQINEYEETEDFIKFDFRLQKGDFAYPLSTDGHIFRTKEIRSLIRGTRFNNPNTLEANLQRFLNGIKHMIVSFKTSKVVSIPVNLVNTTFNNNHGLTYDYDVDELNTKFLNNEFIDFSELDLSGINGPHKEIEYKFIKI